MATGANAVRPNPAYGPVFVFTSDGKRDQTAIASSLTRRLKNHFQAGVTWTLMLEMKDNGTVGYGTSPANNPFDYLNGEWATSQDFQRNTIRDVGARAAAVGHQRERRRTSTDRATASPTASRRRRTARPARTA